MHPIARRRRPCHSALQLYRLLKAVQLDACAGRDRGGGDGDLRR